MEIHYDQLGGVHFLTAILLDPVRYAIDHGRNTFVLPGRLPLYNKILPTMRRPSSKSVGKQTTATALALTIFQLQSGRARRSQVLPCQGGRGLVWQP